MGTRCCTPSYSHIDHDILREAFAIGCTVSRIARRWHACTRTSSQTCSAARRMDMKRRPNMNNNITSECDVIYCCIRIGMHADIHPSMCQSTVRQLL